MKTKFGNFETLTLDGATRLCQIIKAYWASQGKTVAVWPVLLPGLRAAENRRVWSIESDIVINRFDAPIPAIVQRTTPHEDAHYTVKPRKEAA